MRTALTRGFVIGFFAAFLCAAAAVADGAELPLVQVTPARTLEETKAEMAQAMAQARPPATHLEPVQVYGPYDPSDLRKAVFPEAFTSDAVAWMEAEYAAGASAEMTILKRTDDGFRLVYLYIPGFLEDYMSGEAQARYGLRPGDKPKPARCEYDIPQPVGHRILAAARAVLHKTRPNRDKGMVYMGVDLEFFARDGSKALSGQVANPRADSEPAMLASVLT